MSLKSMVLEKLRELKIPGAIVSVTGSALGKQAFVLTYGYSDIQKEIPMNLNTHFRIGSITKTFTGTLILQLVDEGKVKLSDTLSKYLVGIPFSDSITIEQLGNMSSGYYNYSNDSLFDSILEKQPYRNWIPTELISIGTNHNLNFKPGTEFNYSNTNSILLALIIEQVTGNSYQFELNERILKPLGLTETRLETSTDLPYPYAHGYSFSKPSSDPLNDKNNKSNKIIIRDVTHWNPSWAWSAGAMSSTWKDTRNWIQAVTTGKLLSKSSYKSLLKTIPLSKNSPASYGFHISTNTNFIGHNGSIPGYQSFAVYNPINDVTIVILINVQYTENGLSPADELGQYIVQILSKY